MSYYIKILRVLRECEPSRCVRGAAPSSHGGLRCESQDMKKAEDGKEPRAKARDKVRLSQRRSKIYNLNYIYLYM